MNEISQKSENLVETQKLVHERDDYKAKLAKEEQKIKSLEKRIFKERVAK